MHISSVSAQSSLQLIRLGASVQRAKLHRLQVLKEYPALQEAAQAAKVAVLTGAQEQLEADIGELQVLTHCKASLSLHERRSPCLRISMAAGHCPC